MTVANHITGLHGNIRGWAIPVKQEIAIITKTSQIRCDTIVEAVTWLSSQYYQLTR